MKHYKNSASNSFPWQPGRKNSHCVKDASPCTTCHVFSSVAKFLHVVLSEPEWQPALCLRQVHRSVAFVEFNGGLVPVQDRKVAPWTTNVKSGLNARFPERFAQAFYCRGQPLFLTVGVQSFITLRIWVFFFVTVGKYWINCILFVIFCLWP